MLTRRSDDKCLERRAMRGLAVARRMQGDRAGAITDLQAVLDISKAMGEFTGDTDALGAIADLYTELGDLERAGSYYDQYIAALRGENLNVD
jgi:tetratricopeptide (TPR) repeat protein